MGRKTYTTTSNQLFVASRKSFNIFLGFLNLMNDIQFTQYSHILNQTLAVLDKIRCYGKNSTYHCILSWLKKNNYYTELSKISWYINNKQINYFPKPKAETKKWPSWQWKIRMFWSNHIQWSMDHQAYFHI